MAKFDIGETVICACEVKDDAGAYKDPATSMNIEILNQNGVTIIASTAMTKDAVGKYHYDYNSANAAAGGYKVIYTATDGTRKTIEKDTFRLE